MPVQPQDTVELVVKVEGEPYPAADMHYAVPISGEEVERLRGVLNYLLEEADL